MQAEGAVSKALKGRQSGEKGLELVRGQALPCAERGTGRLSSQKRPHHRAVAMGELAARARNQEMPESGNALKPKGGRGLVGRIPCAA